METYRLSKIFQNRINQLRNNLLETHRNNKTKIKEYETRIKENKDLIRIFYENNLISEENYNILNIF